jgi:hypothetical protein
VFVACVPIIWEPVLDEFHPQDLVAVGLTLIGLACVVRRWWIWAGVWLGLAVSSQQFALLLLVPLIVLAPLSARWRLILAAAGSWCVITFPAVAAARGQGVSAAIFGSGDYGSVGGTLLWQLNIHHGPGLIFLSRIMPILVAALLAVWGRRMLGPSILDPIPLISLMATCIGLRLVFEQGLFGYKFMALSVLLIVLGVACGRIRGVLIAWLALVTLAYQPIPFGLAFNGRSWGYGVFLAEPFLALEIAAAVLIWFAVSRRRIQWYIVGFLIVVILLTVPPNGPFVNPPTWLWQIILLGSGIWLAIEPLTERIRAASNTGEDHPGAPLTVAQQLSSCSS